MHEITKNDAQDALSRRHTKQGQNVILLLTLPNSETFQCLCRVLVALIENLESERAREFFATHESISQFTKTFKNGGQETRGARCTRDKGRGGVCLPPHHSLPPLEATYDPTWHNAIEGTWFLQATWRPSFRCTVRWNFRHSKVCCSTIVVIYMLSNFVYLCILALGEVNKNLP